MWHDDGANNSNQLLYGVFITILTPWKPQTNQNVTLIWFNFDVLQIHLFHWSSLFVKFIYTIHILRFISKIYHNEIIIFFLQKCNLTMYRNAPAIIVMRVQKKASNFLNPNCSKNKKVKVSAPVIRTPAQIGILKEGKSQLEEFIP